MVGGRAARARADEARPPPPPVPGKFIPQLVEVLLDRYFAPGAHVLDPFAGSGTTLVQALESGLDATGVDIAAFNCLLIASRRRVRPAALEQELRDVYARIESLGCAAAA